MACKRSPVRLRHSPPNEIKASEKSGALLFLAGSNMVQTFLVIDWVGFGKVASTNNEMINDGE